MFNIIEGGLIRMQEYQIWDKGACFGLSDDEGGMVIPGEEIYNSVYMGDVTCYGIEGMLVEKIDELNEVLNNIEESIEDMDQLQEFLDNNNFKYDELTYLSDNESQKSFVYYDTYNKIFSDLVDCETTPAYQWWDGSNWRTEYAGEDVTVTVVMVENEVYRDLDEWDGQNWCTGGQRFYHEQVYKVLELDDEKVEGMYLVYGYSQWQDSHATGKIMIEDELNQHIEEINQEIEYAE